MKFLKDIKKSKKELLRNKVESGENLLQRVKELNIAPGVFVKALRKQGVSLIAEVKMASPSKGPVSRYGVEELAAIYANLNVDAVSVLTEGRYFAGSLNNIIKVKAVYSGPVLMKDFIISEYQIYEGVLNGASGVLLIAAMLSGKELKKLLGTCKSLGISAIVEVHSKKELKKCLGLEGLEIIGVNSRNLKTLAVDNSVHHEMAPLIPSGLVKVAESGINSAEYVRKLYELGYDAVLVGESLVSSENPQELIVEIKALGN